MAKEWRIMESYGAAVFSCCKFGHVACSPGFIQGIDGLLNQKYYGYAILEPTKEDVLLESLCIPTQTQVRDQMGSKLADIFFENLSSEARLLLGLQPPLSGPDEVWINPDSRLKNQVRCQPVPEPQVLHHKAFTHEAILELGQNYIDSLNMKLQKEIEESLKGQSASMEEECNKRLIEALEVAKIEADEHCKQIVGTLMEHFDRCFTEMVEESRLRMRKECQLRVQEERSELAAYMLVQLQDEVERRDLELCSDFHDTLKWELDAQATRFIKQIDAERKVAREVLEDVVQKYERSLVDLRTEMEIASFVDICRAINEEKSKHEKESQAGHEETKKKLGFVVQEMLDLKNKNEILQKMVVERAKRIAEYEKKMKELVDEFQKFVNFALKAVPGHAQFLLSAQKMVMKKFHEDTLLKPEDYEDFKNCLANKTPTETPAGSLSIEERICPPEEKEEVKAQKAVPCNKEKDSKYTFNYYRFKYNLLKKFVKGLNFDEEKSTEEKSRCVSRKKTEKRREVEDDVLSERTRAAVEEYKQALILDGETAKEHLKPVGTFLQNRMKMILQMCKDDPDMVRFILGGPKPKPGP